MKNSTYKDFIKSLKTRWILAISTGLILASCGSQMTGYTETDGIYYDPKKDVIPEGYLGRIAEGTDYDYYAPEENTPSIIEQNQQNQQAQQNRYQRWNQNNATQSDWGNYAGTERNFYSNDWGWGSPFLVWGGPGWGWGNRWNMGLNWGWGANWGWGLNWGIGYNWGWGNPWGYNPYWDPFWGGYYGGAWMNPWYGGFYDPWFYGGGWGRPYNYRRSGADAINRGNSGFQQSSNVGNRGFNRVQPGVSPNTYNNNNNSYNNGFRRSGFGSPNSSVNPNPNNNYSAPVTPNGGFRRSSSDQSTSQPSYSAPRNEGFRSSSGGFGGGSSGGARSGGSGGGFRGGFR